MVLSSLQIFIYAKIKPYSDWWMNLFQTGNEAFLFFGCVMLMPLANVENDLNVRNNLGWVMYYVLIACIIYNTIILMLRTLRLLYDYCN